MRRCVERFLDEYLGYRSTPEDFFLSGRTLEELAALEGIDAAGLAATVAPSTTAVQADGTAPGARPPKGVSEDFPKIGGAHRNAARSTRSSCWWGSTRPWAASR